MKKKRKQKPMDIEKILKDKGDNVITEEMHEKFKRISTAPRIKKGSSK